MRRVKVDRIDRRILRDLQSNGRSVLSTGWSRDWLGVRAEFATGRVKTAAALRRAQYFFEERPHVQFNPAVYDLWVFRRRSHGVEYLVLRTSQIKADRHFNGGRFWQILSVGAPAMGTGDRLDDGKAQSRAAALAGARVVSAKEAIEH